MRKVRKLIASPEADYPPQTRSSSEVADEAPIVYYVDRPLISVKQQAVDREVPVQSATRSPGGVRAIPRGTGRRIRILAGYSEWKLMAADTGGQYFVLESVVPPGGGVPIHRHRDQEAFHVLEGELEFARVTSSGVEWFSAAPGDSVHAPGNEFHGVRNRGSVPARVAVTATAGLAAFFEEAGTVLEPGSVPAPGPPAPDEVQRVLAIARRHGHVFLEV